MLLIIFLSIRRLAYIYYLFIIFIFLKLLILIEKILEAMNFIWHLIFIVIAIFFVCWSSLIFFLLIILILQKFNLLLESLKSMTLLNTKILKIRFFLVHILQLFIKTFQLLSHLIDYLNLLLNYPLCIFCFFFVFLFKLFIFNLKLLVFFFLII